MDNEGIYHPLGKKSFRLLEIVPALADEQIECVLTTIHNIEDSPDFEALSYVWGDTLSPHPIICNGVRMIVTQNLEEALRYLRPLPTWESVPIWSTKHDFHSSRQVWGAFARNRYEQQENAMLLRLPVWIDAICINQDDLAERANQVKLMRKIYHTASTVKIWLGKEQKPAAPNPVVSREIDESPVLMANHPMLTRAGTNTYSMSQSVPFESQVRWLAPRHHMETYGSMPIVLSFLAQALRNLEAQSNTLLSLRPLQDSEHRNLVYGLPSPSAREWKTFRDFLSNPWFQRIWIVQEAVLARQAVAVIGNWHINWKALGKATTWFEAKGYAMPRTMRYTLNDPKDLLPVTGASALWQMCELPNKRVPLLALLKDFRSRQTSQDVDKLYAAFGLAQETEGSDQDGFHTLLEPNYDKPLVEVYRDLALFLIIEHGSLDVLSHVEIAKTQSSTWPSWVPDWCIAKASSEIWSPKDTLSFCADLNEPLSLNFEEEVNSLSLEGLNVDTIRFYGDKLISYGFGFETYTQEVEFVNSAWSLAKLVFPIMDYVDKQIIRDHLQTFITTLLAHDPKLDVDGLMHDAGAWLSKHLSLQFPGLGSKWFSTTKTDTGRFHDAFVRICTEKRFFITRCGRMGIGPESMKENDEVVILFGANVPFVIRRSGPTFTLIGECYVTGIMNGEPVEQWRSRGGARDRFDIR
ncbi:heterokaryon incompatibility protein-domain-containing protein [Xylaria arbuscula]|nr:heterokaryon incompatibility protein-domain-containing protein [Xylaria arbuscula]